jgi:hypothetical protein
MGCGCNKASTAPNALARRVTVYQVIDSSNNQVGEFSTLPEARAEAVKVAGRVKVSTKVLDA